MWKKPVTRPVIDVLYASVDDLNASKGVIFTTKGYEEGAIEYAKNKNIDIFIIRDIRQDEYGHMGKVFSLYTQLFNGKLQNFELENARWFSPINNHKRTDPFPEIVIHFTKEQAYPERLQLFDINYNKGPHLIKLLINIRKEVLSIHLAQFKDLLQPENENVDFAFKLRVKLNFKPYKFKYLIHQSGFVALDTVSFDMLCCVTQSKFTNDKTENYDFALIVENYISNQRNFVSNLSYRTN